MNLPDQLVMPAAAGVPLIGSALPNGLPWPAVMVISVFGMTLLGAIRIHAQIIEARQNACRIDLATAALELVTTGALADVSLLLGEVKQSRSIK